MSDGFDRFAAWLDSSHHDRSPGYYGLLKLAVFEADPDRIEQALFQESLDVSNFLRGPQRDLAEAVLEQINRAESCLTNETSKAAYDARLRAAVVQPGLTPVLSIETPPEPDAEPRNLPIEAVTPAVAADHHPQPRSPAHAAKSAGGNSAASAADRGVWEAIEQARRRSSDDSRKKTKAPSPPPAPLPEAVRHEPAVQTPAEAPNSQTVSLSSAIAQSLVARIPAPLVKYRGRIAAGIMVLFGVGFAIQFASSALDTPRPPRVRVRLDPEEEILLSQQISVLYNLSYDTATRAAAAEKLRTVTPAAIRKFSYNLGDLASKQPEPEIQQALRSLLESAGSGS